MAEPPAVIWKHEVQRLLQYGDLVPRLEEALGKFSTRDSAEVIQPVRNILPLQKHHGFLGSMPTYMENDGVLCTKLVCFYHRDAGSALPATQATVILLDPEYGNVKAVIDGEEVTGMRTAAVSAISAKLLMRPGAEVLAILGTGKQALTHYHIFTEMFPFKEVRVWSRTSQGAERFCRSVGGPVRACVSVEEAVRGADAIVTVTGSTEPVLFGRWVKAGAHVAAVGACRPNWRELDDALMKEAVVYSDSRDGAMQESGDVILSGVRPLSTRPGDAAGVRAVTGCEPSRCRSRCLRSSEKSLTGPSRHTERRPPSSSLWGWESKTPWLLSWCLTGGKPKPARREVFS
uniref:Ketimine reductase mu-crystallin n=1 Tax=Gasterosteus aculeatus aculeatus TaxID=481459 RepID=G3P4U2_GASAC